MMRFSIAIAAIAKNFIHHRSKGRVIAIDFQGKKTEKMAGTQCYLINVIGRKPDLRVFTVCYISRRSHIFAAELP